MKRAFTVGFQIPREHTVAVMGVTKVESYENGIVLRTQDHKDYTIDYTEMADDSLIGNMFIDTSSQDAAELEDAGYLVEDHRTKKEEETLGKFELGEIVYNTGTNKKYRVLDDNGDYTLLMEVNAGFSPTGRYVVAYGLYEVDESTCVSWSNGHYFLHDTPFENLKGAVDFYTKAIQ